MKPTKPASAEGPALRRSQPVRQTRVNPSRYAANAGRDASNAGASASQPITIFPAITHFADTISALPKELVRHFTLLKEVDAKLFAPEEHLAKLVAAAVGAPPPEPRAGLNNTYAVPWGVAVNQADASVSSTDDVPATSGVFDASNIPRRQLFRQTALRIQEMLVSLEEKNHVISTANEALQRQLLRAEDVWPYLEKEFSDEAKWGSSTHWAYPENRLAGKVSHTERARRDGAAAISAAAQALADEAAARSDARKQAVQAKRNQKNQHHDSDADDHHDSRPRAEAGKKAHNSKARKVAEISGGASGATASANGNPPQKRRKVEKTTNGTNGGPYSDRATVGSHAPKAKTSSPRATPVPDLAKKRKALPTASGHAKKKSVHARYRAPRALTHVVLYKPHELTNGASHASPPMASSPVLTTLPEPKGGLRTSPAPGNAPRPASSRARKNSLQSNAEGPKTKSLSSANNKPNGDAAVAQDTAPSALITPRTGGDNKTVKEAEPATKEGERDRIDGGGGGSGPTPGPAKKESKAEEAEPKSEPLPSQPQSAGLVTTKSGRTSKPSTPALANAQELMRPRSSRNTDGGNGNKKQQKRSNTTTTTTTVPHNADEEANSSMHGEDEGDMDADEPTYCHCNSVSYGEMVACDADGCEREWFHLACVGLKVAPGSKTKWYCEDCKERLKMGGKKATSR
ncbi:hypothetical protein L249_2255 [Ophiocordyceps polyrhachis-furcata BCC 54312]|uniref:Chromatin modification-related protein n=1 Tax=Ophiocordyceps polyrhachis-furcata BCC 54312 TaxID=1330021 RepID=A0A367LQ47_9HYPO|nr:hypothetical protein L249_2255 [Ophiocordyceps polyrhachis-furcata BCC 54312]